MKTETITRALKVATSSQLASELASRSTPAKAKAARENGKKGGWPKGRPRKPNNAHLTADEPTGPPSSPLHSRRLD